MATPTLLNTLPDPIVDYFAATNPPTTKQSQEDTLESTLVPVEDPKQNDELPQAKILKIEPPPPPPPQKMPAVTAPVPDKAGDAMKRTQSQQPTSTPVPLITRETKVFIKSPKGTLVPVLMSEKGDRDLLLVIVNGRAFRAISTVNYLQYGFVKQGNKFFHPKAPFEQVECIVM